MNNFIIYSIEIAISLALFYSAYWIFLKNETFFKLNRFYLVFSVAISLLTPLLNITMVTHTGEDSFISHYLVLPVEQYEQQILGNMYPGTGLMKNKRPFPGDMEHTAGININPANNTQPVSVETIPVNSTENNTTKTTSWLTWLLVIYFIGAALFFIRFLANFIWIFGYTLKNKSQHIFDMKVIRLEKNTSPFSFLNLIFISQKEYPEDELTKIISHEKVHIRQKHSIDLILFELLLVFQWFNPFVWLYKRSIKITHEYLADQGTLSSGVDLPGYQYSLLNQALSEHNFEIASNYNLTIKKRIEMMMKKRSPKLSALKLTIVLPILVFLFSAFAFKTYSLKDEVKQNENNSVAADSDTIKKINVPVEYLKLLEGEYVATNEPGRMRKIRFDEVLGTLMANDAGYVYKIIPVAEGKFINPDDNAPFTFDTQNNDAITLLLFGRIKLNKVKEPDASLKKSTAYLVTRAIANEGTTAALSKYKEIKNSNKYKLEEGEMNYAGYLLLQSGKAKEASEIFKLNVEAFPNSYNVYDSYAESLLALGDKNKATENYIKSVKLNPGSKSGIAYLKQVGINPDTLVKKVNVSEAYLKLLEGEYISTNDPNGIRKIWFTLEDGILEGNDAGYHYKLIPKGDGKFINPDDGASFLFDTKDKNAISLLLFGTINLKKSKEESIKKVKVSEEYLQSLTGEYISTNQPNGVRKIIFTVEKGTLVGNDNGYRYMPVYIGDGKFINPDDDQSLIFDTKDKNAITLLLFGKINLKKIK